MSDTPTIAKFSRRLAASLGAKIAGYSALIGTDEDRTVQDFKADGAATVPPDEALQVQFARPRQPNTMQRLNSQGYWFGTRSMTMLKRKVRANSAHRRAKAEQPTAHHQPSGLHMRTLSETTVGEDPPEARDITRKLAHYVVAVRFEDLPEGVRREIGRSLLNWLGVAVGGSRHEAVEIALGAVTPFSGPPQASLFGRSERLDVINAALINGISSHVFDFDDTDLLTAVHPSAPVMPTVLALAELNAVSGRDLVTAIAMGFEVECRLGRAVQPALGAIGWHPTGVVGVFGAAVAAGKLLGLDEERLCHAVGLAATQPVGVREMFGSMTKSFHPGRAAQSGLLAAFLAEKGYTSSLQGIEAKCGWARLVSAKQDWQAITDGLGEDYEIYRNTYKPFACGLVVHPVIDGCIQLRNEHNLTAGMIERVVLEVSPIVLELTNKRTPHTGLEGKFSVYYVAALAIVAGRADEAQFSNGMVCDPVITALRDRVSATANPSVAKQQARVRIHLRDGRVLERFITEAVGSVKNPMSDAALDAKFTDLAGGVLPADRTRRLIDLCRSVERLADAGDVARAAATGSPWDSTVDR